MRINHRENGVIVIDQDEAVLAKIKNESLDGVDVNDLRVDADTLAKLYGKAATNRTTLDAIKRYAVMKQKYLEKFSAK